MAAPTRIGLLLTDGFSLISYAAILEPFRAANDLSGQELYAWLHIAVNGDAVYASNGATLMVQASVKTAPACDVVFAFASADCMRFKDRETLAWLRRLARANVRLGGVSGGAFLLAQAGLLDGYRCTIHWDYAAALQDAYPQLAVEDALFVSDRRRLTCAGGVAGLDLAIEIIAREQGAELARAVGDWFLRSQPRLSKDKQRASLQDRFGVRNARVLSALARMEGSIESPEPRHVLARAAGVSIRQLERLFAAHLGASIDEIYRRIRLDQAERLLAGTAMSVTAISLACGYANIAALSRAFKTRRGVAPSIWRSQQA